MGLLTVDVVPSPNIQICVLSPYDKSVNITRFAGEHKTLSPIIAMDESIVMKLKTTGGPGHPLYMGVSVTENTPGYG